MLRICLGLLVLLMAVPTEAQRRRGAPRVIQLELHHERFRPRPPLMMYVGAADACPSATLLRLCGGDAPPAGTCPELEPALSSVQVDRCRVEDALMPVAIALQRGMTPETLRASLRLFERLAEQRRHRAFAALAQMTLKQRLASSNVPPHELMARLMAMPRLAPGMRAAAIEVYAHSLVTLDADEDGANDLAGEESILSTRRLPDMPGASDIAWRALERLMEGAEFQEVQRALDAFEARWPEVRRRDRMDMRARALRDNLQYDEMLDHLRAAPQRCRRAACRTHFRQALLAALVEGLRACRAAAVERRGLRRCMRDALEAEELVTQDTPPNLRDDIASTVRWAAGELRDATGSRAPEMATARVDSGNWGGDVDWRGVWRFIEMRSLDALRRCGARRGSAIALNVRVDEDGVFTLEEASRARRCVGRALPNRNPSLGAQGGDGFVRGTLVFAPRE